MKLVFDEEDLRGIFKAIQTGKVCDLSAEPCEKFRNKKTGHLECDRCVGGLLINLIDGCLDSPERLQSIIDEGKSKLDKYGR